MLDQFERLGLFFGRQSLAIYHKGVLLTANQQG